MNHLERLIEILELKPDDAMKALKVAGIVADECSGPETVAAGDVEPACECLKYWAAGKD